MGAQTIEVLLNAGFTNIEAFSCIPTSFENIKKVPELKSLKSGILYTIICVVKSILPAESTANSTVAIAPTSVANEREATADIDHYEQAILNLHEGAVSAVEKKSQSKCP